MGATGTKPFNASLVSYEQKISQKKQLNDYFAVGGMMMMESSNGGLLKNNYLNLSTAYHNALNEDGTRKLSVGLGVVYANRMLDASKFITQSQFGSFGSLIINKHLIAAYATHERRSWNKNTGRLFRKSEDGCSVHSCFDFVVRIVGYFNFNWEVQSFICF
jgi:hypothetical protein